MGSGSSKQKNSKNGDKMHLVKVIEESTSSVNSMSITPDGSKVVTGSEDGAIRIYGIPDYEPLGVLKGHERYINYILTSEKYVYSASADKTIRKWSIGTGLCVKTFRGHTDGVNRIVLVGNALFSSSYDKTVRAWEVDSGELLRVFQGHKKLVNSLVYVPSDIRKDKDYNYAELDHNDDSLISGSADCTAKLWALNSSECVLTYRGHTEPILCLTVDATGNHLFTGSQDNTIKSWEVMTGKCLKTFGGHQSSIIQIEVILMFHTILTDFHSMSHRTILPCLYCTALYGTTLPCFEMCYMHRIK